jgi:hypothetical protein
VTLTRLTCRIHGPNQLAYVVCSHIVDGEPCTDIEVHVDSAGGEAVCGRDHYDHKRHRIIGKEPTVMCEGCALFLVVKAESQNS